MKALTEKQRYTGSNAWGRTCVTNRQQFEVEQRDVGTTRANYRGYGQPAYCFTLGDVGRKIEVITDETGYDCFSFTS